MQTQTVVQKISSTLQAYRACALCPKEDLLAAEWAAENLVTLSGLVRRYLPRGRGFDTRTLLDFISSHPNRLMFQTDYHHSAYTVTVTPTFEGINVEVKGPNNNGTGKMENIIKKTFYTSLMAVLPVTDTK